MARPSYQAYVDEQRAGKLHGVFIDDTGSPGLQNTPPNLHADRKSWVAVVVPRTVIAEIWEQFPRAIAELKNQTGATEFHFTDIYSGTRSFKGVALEKRLAVFAFMAEIFRQYRFPVFVQTLDPDTLRDVRKRGPFPKRLGRFDFEKHEDFALFFLLLRVKWHLEKNYPESDRLARVFVDEGFQRNGAGIAVPPLRHVFADGLICFGRSSSILPLQLADFAAFCLNRTQLIIGRREIRDLDESFLRLIEPVVWNYENIPRVSYSDWIPKDDRRPLH